MQLEDLLNESFELELVGELLHSYLDLQFKLKEQKERRSEMSKGQVRRRIGEDERGRISCT